MSFASLKTIKPFFTDKCGRLLAGGKVFTYEAKTLSPKATFKDPSGLTTNTNPIVLDASGEADIYINSDYRFQIFDCNNILIKDIESVAPTQRISTAFLIDESGFSQAQINSNKEDKLNKGAANGYASLDANTRIPVTQLPNASTIQQGIVQLVNDLTTGGVDKSLTAEMGKALNTKFISKITHGGINPVTVMRFQLVDGRYMKIQSFPVVLTPSVGMHFATTQFSIPEAYVEFCNPVSVSSTGFPSGPLLSQYNVEALTLTGGHIAHVSQIPNGMDAGTVFVTLLGI